VKRIRKSKATRILSWVLAVAMITPLVCGMITPRTARAQGATAPTPGGIVQTVAVIDFEDKSGFPNRTLGRLATDAVATELSNTERFIVLPRSEVVSAANQLNLRPPYDDVAMAKLADSLGATAIVTGSIEGIQVDTRRTPRTVSVALTVGVRDAASGDFVNGAAVIGSARSRPGQEDVDSLAQEAIGNAAVLAVKQILAFNLPEGTVLNTVGRENSLLILINRGSRDGIREGMELIVTRERQRVARIRVTSVFPTDSECEPADSNLGIAPGDKVRAVFTPPTITRDFKTTEPGKKRTSTFSTLGKVLLVLVLGLVIYEVVHGGRTTVTGVTAEPDIQNGAPAVRIVWRDNLFGSGSQTLEYHVWRTPDASFNFEGIPVAAVSGGMRSYTDLPLPFSFWDGVKSFLQPAFGTGGGQGQSNTATVVTPAAGAVPGFTTGLTITYQVTAVIRRPLITGTGGGTGGGGGGTTGFQDIESDVVTSGPTTPINQPLLGPNPADQASNVDLSNVTFTWFSRTGADTFQVEVSTDPTFKNRNLIAVLGRVFSTAPLAEGVQQNLGPVNLLTNAALKRDKTFADFVNQVAGAPKPTLYWRVGGRNSQDRPGPVHWISRRHNDPDNTFRFIYSQPRSFTPADLPPPPP